MNPSIALLTLALVGGNLARGAALPPQEAARPAGATSARVQGILEEYDAARQAFGQAYGKAQTDAERERVFEEQYPRADAYVARLMAAADSAPADPGTAAALLWVMRQADDAALFERAAQLLVEHHLGSEEAGPACAAAERQLAGGREFLVAVAEGAPRDETRALARFSLALNSLERAEHARRVAEASAAERSGLEARLGAETVAALAAEGPTAPLLEAEALLEVVAAESGDVASARHGTLGAACQIQLFELRRLQVGMPAPDIVGEDLDGVPFQLSDYRGKVVVLDFWGNW